MNYYLKKTISFILTLVTVALVSFVLFRMIPGDAAAAKLGTEATEEQLEALRAEYGLDKSTAERFVTWLGGAVRGDFGMSLRYSRMTVNELIGQRLPVTVTLAVMSLVLIAVIAVPLGLFTSLKPGGAADVLTDWLSQAVMAVPSFVQGIIVTIVFGLVFHAFVPGGYVPLSEDPLGCISFMFFPALSVALPKAAMTVRFMKTAVKRELKADYVRTARAKGCPDSRVMWQHVFRNSIMPVITFMGMVAAEVLAGSIMIEQVFNLPGIGRLLVTSISSRDFNVVQAIVIYIAAVVLFVNLLVDILYRLTDPRLRHEA